MQYGFCYASYKNWQAVQYTGMVWNGLDGLVWSYEYIVLSLVYSQEEGRESIYHCLAAPHLSK